MNKNETTPTPQPSQVPQTKQAPQQPSQPQPSQASPAQPPQKPKRRWWLWGLGILLVLFLGTIGGVVPVENVPILRNLAHAMGFTPQEAEQMSFLRALLTWTDKTVGLNGRLSAWPTSQDKSSLSSAFGDEAAAPQGDDKKTDLQGNMARYGVRMDDETLQALKQQPGMSAIAGVVTLQPGQTSNPRAIMPGTDVSVNTDANKTQNEVYFGSIIASLNRDTTSGYDTGKILKKVKNPHIADGQPIDWLQQMTSRLKKADPGLVGVDKDLGTSVIGWNINVQEQGDGKGQRDLYYAWITSRMSKYTTNLMLKKRLADIGFLGGEIPTHMSDSFVIGGIYIDSDSLAEDQEGWKKYQEFEKNCKEELLEPGRGGDKVKQAVDSFNSKFSTWPIPIQGKNEPPANFGFPQNCDGFKTLSRESYASSLRQIQTDCKEARAGYGRLHESCAMVVDWDKECGDGFITTYVDRWDSFYEYCNNYCEQEAAKYPPGTYDIENCKQNIQPGIDTWDGNEAKNTEVELLAEVGGSTDYFPQIVKGEKDAQGLVKDEQGVKNVKETIENRIYKF